MNQARDKVTGEIIDAESLKHLYEDGLSEYECIDEKCKIKLLPCSYKPTNKNRPYFKTYKGDNHKKTCQFSLYLKLLEKARKRALTNYELEDMPFPTKFQRLKQIDTTNITSKTDDLGQEQSRKSAVRRKASGEFVEVLNKSKVVASISPIVDFYLKCPYNRNTELEIENESMLYRYWFKRIEKPISKGNYKGKRIFFGRLHAGENKITETEDFMDITLYECEGWKSGSRQKLPKQQINPFIVRINKTIISKNKLSRIKNEIGYVIEEKKNAFKNDEANKKKAFIFFLGEAPKAEDPYVFNVLEGALVSRYTQILPTKN
ncbi:hypothetical protein [uncultured Tenacibaculum sp.]|uniref:hypothetical protein n=1 Tax=uncultured Tenacibaculum sp. TaxID=174713 RepID=UPI00261DEAC0|nr:hypothetical protein [uncultured Tenacibaculum sp.]